MNNELEKLLNDFNKENNYKCFKEILEKFNEESFISLYKKGELIFGMDNNKKKFIPLFTSLKKIDNNIEYEEEKESYFSDILCLFVNSKKYDYIIINPNSDNFIFNEKMIEMVIKN